jgi:cytochrome P450
VISAAILATRGKTAAESEFLFDALVSARNGDGQFLDDEEIQDHIFTMLVAGVDPTAIALAWGLYWVLETPGVKTKVLEEVRTLGSDPDPAEVCQLPYLTAVSQESLRMYPVVATPSGRKLKATTKILDWPFEPGVTLLPCTYLVHRREDLYSEPHSFQPERFLKRQYSPYEYFPYGGGNRVCIGTSLAMLEMRVALATILTACNLESASEGPVVPVRHGTLLAPSSNMRILVKGPARLAVG